MFLYHEEHETNEYCLDEEIWGRCPKCGNHLESVHIVGLGSVERGCRCDRCLSVYTECDLQEERKKCIKRYKKALKKFNKATNEWKKAKENLSLYDSIFEDNKLPGKVPPCDC